MMAAQMAARISRNRTRGGDVRVIPIRQKNAGVSAARNAGLDIASGDFIAFIDSDDWVHPQYFEVLINGYRSTNANIIACNYIRSSCLEAGDYTPYISGKVNYEQLSFREIVGDGYLKRLVWGRLYAKSIVAHIRFDTGLQWGEDTAFNLSALLSSQNPKFIRANIPLYFYYFRDTSISSTIRYERRLRLPKWYLAHYHEFENIDAQRYILEQACRDVLSSRYAETFSPEKAEAFSACKSIMKDCLRELGKSKLTSPFQNLKYRILFYFPTIYRMIRILDDKTLLAWEKTMKDRSASNKSPKRNADK